MAFCLLAGAIAVVGAGKIILDDLAGVRVHLYKARVISRNAKTKTDIDTLLIASSKQKTGHEENNSLYHGSMWISFWIPVSHLVLPGLYYITTLYKVI